MLELKKNCEKAKYNETHIRTRYANLELELES